MTPGSGPAPKPKRKTPNKGGRPRTKAKISTRGSYVKYRESNLDEAVRAVKIDGMTMREASKRFTVPKATLCDHVHKQLKSVGRPTVLSADEERIIVQRLIYLGIWGFPITPKDLSMLVKDYLDASGRTSRKMFQWNVKTLVILTEKNLYQYYQYRYTSTGTLPGFIPIGLLQNHKRLLMFNIFLMYRYLPVRYRYQPTDTFLS